MKYNINNKWFRTKKEAYEYTFNFLKENKYETIKEGEKFDYLMGMVNIHHNKEEKIGEGIISFYIGDDWNKKTALFINQKNKKEKVSISWVQICKFKPPTLREDYLSSLRQCINYQIEEFKKDTILICDFCKADDRIHIDHIYPFKNIVEDFEEEYNFDIPKKYSKELITNKTMFCEEDKELRETFKIFHNNKSSLRPLCRSCNIGRNRKKP